MDFGFGAFLEKFQEYFGKLATRILVALMGLAVCSACLGVIWKLLSAVSTQTDKHHLSGIWSVATIVIMAVWVVFSVSTFIENRKIKAHRKEMDQVSDILEYARSLNDETERQHKAAMDHYSASLLAYSATIDVIKRSGQVTPETIELIQSLLDIEAGTPP